MSNKRCSHDSIERVYGSNEVFEGTHKCKSCGKFVYEDKTTLYDRVDKAIRDYEEGGFSYKQARYLVYKEYSSKGFYLEGLKDE